MLLLAISSLLFGPGWTKYWYWYAFFGTNIGEALGQSGHQSLGPLWSLAVEEQFYLVWPVVVLSLSRSSLLRLAMSALVIVPLLRAVATPFFDTSFPIFYLTPFRMDLLCAGAAIAVLFRNQPLPRYLDRAAYAGFFAAGTVLLFLSRNPGFRTAATVSRPIHFSIP